LTIFFFARGFAPRTANRTWGKKPGRYDDERGCTCS
jgi:hypothetical protein